ncbi:hypothetical protein QPL79_07375 [Ignisphaera sp. 4213-co]|uniref:Uncharacterized protein n=1 Tax=Ignisphaera cupida TaxID=3050454 RepID=A0ABD4Z780_9CREN|nr:hypothetical protein [Ignisphaera sp. 4213-co]MDK6029181.1 hypothetical protein [Ignisphaera sp. 4213-co]
MKLIRLEHLISDIVTHGKLVFISPYSNFNIVFSLWLSKELNIRGRNPCIYFDDTYIEQAMKNLCKDDEVEIHVCASISSNSSCIIKVVETLSKCIDSGEACSICLVNSVRRYNSVGDNKIFYNVRIVKPNLYKISKMEGNRVLGYLFLKMNMCELIEYKLPPDLYIVYDELQEIVNEFGSIKVSDFLKYITKRKNMDKEQVINILRLAISMGIIRYDGKYLTIY